VSGFRDRVRRFLQKPGTADLTRYREILAEVAEREQRAAGLTDGELTVAAGVATGEADICALGREAARRGLGERPYDVQLLGTLAMLAGQVAEMATGEGKTLAGALAAAGYALRGRCVQVMSVNDYLARRDAEWMGPVYRLLGVSVGWIGQASTAEERRHAYAAQVTYASVSEIGFDVLRDRLVTGPTWSAPSRTWSSSTRPTPSASTRRWSRSCWPARESRETPTGTWRNSSGGCAAVRTTRSTRTRARSS
jgi:preprotein translocase subunit SecA